MIGLIASARARITVGAPEAGFWTDRLKSIIEIASRIILRAPARAPAVFEICLSLQADFRFNRHVDLGNELRHLAKRSLEAAEDESRDVMLLSLFQMNIVPDMEAGGNTVTDLAASMSHDFEVTTKSVAWDAVAAETIEALTDPTTRNTASLRMKWLLDAGLLDGDDRRRLGDALWVPTQRNGGLPGGTVFYPSSFLSLPYPNGTDVQAAVSSALLTDEPLTDEAVAEGALAYAFMSRNFAMGEGQVLRELARLRAFVANHLPEPPYPELFGNQRTALVRYTSLVAAGLVRRAVDVPDAAIAIRDLFTPGRYPLRIEPSLPALVRIEMVGDADAVRQFRDMLAGNTAIETLMLDGFLDSFSDSQDGYPAFELQIWDEVAQTIVARRPGPLAGLLRFVAHTMQQDAGRVPTSLDGMLSLGLRLILDETSMTSPARHLEYDPLLIRYFAASLITAMARHDRGDAVVHAAWSAAIEDDPLPDTRRARAKALKHSSKSARDLGDDVGDSH